MLAESEANPFICALALVISCSMAWSESPVAVGVVGAAAVVAGVDDGEDDAYSLASLREDIHHQIPPTTTIATITQIIIFVVLFIVLA